MTQRPANIEWPPEPSTQPGSERPPIFQRLRTRFLLLIAAVALPLLVLILNTFFEHSRDARQEAGLSVLRLARIVSQQQDQQLETARQLLSTLTQMERWRASTNRPQDSLMLSRLLDLHPGYLLLTVVDGSGRVTATGTDPVKEWPAEGRSWFQKARTQQGLVLGEFQIDSATRRPMLHIAHPILDRTNGLFLGAIHAALDLGWISKFVEDAQLPEKSSLVVLDSSSRVLLHYPKPSEPGSFLGKDAGPVLTGSPWKEQAAGFFEREGHDGESRFYSLARLVGDEDAPLLRVAIGVPTRAAFAASRAILTRNLVVTGAVILLTMLLAWFGTDRFVVRWLKPLLRVAKELHQGNLAARTGLPHRGGELEQLAGAVDEMAASLERRVSERQQVEARLKSLNEDLEKKIGERTGELQRSNRELGEFAYAASHDLQEPLRMISGHLQLLERRYKGKLGPEADEYIHYAVDGAQRMDQLILDLLAYSRVGTQVQTPVPVDLNAVLTRVQDNLTLRIAEAGAVIRSEPLPFVLGDASQLGLVLQNLIGNAIKFRGARVPEVEISCTPAIEQPDTFWRFEIHDNGIGIDPEHFERVFQIFQRLHTREEYPGTGIGLAICKRVIERHGGKIWVESKMGEGTSFFFTLRRGDTKPLLGNA